MSTQFNVVLDYNHKKVLKSGDPRALYVEAMMAEKAHQLSSRYKIFRTPKVISFDPVQGLLELELVENIEALKSFLPDCFRLAPLLTQAAESLVIIHEELKLSAEDLIRVPEELACDACKETPIHGDFTLRNVQYDHVGNQLVIIDWSFAPRFKVAANFGPRFFDLAMMVNSLFSSPPYSLVAKGKDRAELAHIFIDRYFDACSSKDQLKAFAAYLQMVSKMFFRNACSRSSWLRFLRQRRNRKNFVRFAELLG